MKRGRGKGGWRGPRGGSRFDDPRRRGAAQRGDRRFGAAERSGPRGKPAGDSRRPEGERPPEGRRDDTRPREEGRGGRRWGGPRPPEGRWREGRGRDERGPRPPEGRRDDTRPREEGRGGRRWGGPRPPEGRWRERTGREEGGRPKPGRWQQAAERRFGKLPRGSQRQDERRPVEGDRASKRAPQRPFSAPARVQAIEADDHGPVRLLVATEDGEVYDHPALEVLPPAAGDLPPVELGGPDLFRPVPDGSRIVLLPGRKAIGWDPAARRRVVLETLEIGGRERPVFAAAAVLAPAWLRLRCPAFERREGAPELPQWAYTDVGWRGGRAVSAAVRIDAHTHWDTRAYNTPDLEGRVKRRLAAAPGNGVLRQLARCALEYSCTTAQNIFYQRHEGALPVSAACNSECLGCLSYRPPGVAPSSHERLRATARTEDLVEVALEHLRAVPRGIVSFGQGCEGEPLLAGERIERAINAVRARTRAGTLHLNTNASLPSMVGRLFNAGLDSIRVSLNSAVPEHYARYYKPSGYAFEDVRGSIAVARGKGGFVSLNCLVHPGFSDRPSEIDALVSLAKELQVDLIQLRNLAIDPETYLALYPEPEAPAGMGELLRRLRHDCPRTRLGNFNLPKEEWSRESIGAGAAAGAAPRPSHQRRP